MKFLNWIKRIKAPGQELLPQIPKKRLWVKMGGLMEDPYPHWEVIGEAEGETLQEIADNLAKTDEKFREYYDPKRLTFWGWILHLAPAQGETVGPESLKFLS